MYAVKVVGPQRHGNEAYREGYDHGQHNRYRVRGLHLTRDNEDQGRLYQHVAETRAEHVDLIPAKPSVGFKNLDKSNGTYGTASLLTFTYALAGFTNNAYLGEQRKPEASN